MLLHTEISSDGGPCYTEETNLVSDEPDFDIDQPFMSVNTLLPNVSTLILGIFTWTVLLAFLAIFKPSFPLTNDAHGVKLVQTREKCNCTTALLNAVQTFLVL